MKFPLNTDEWATGLTAAGVIAPSIMATAQLSAEIGADFSTATAWLTALVILGTWAANRRGESFFVLAPSVPLATFLVYETIIAEGFTRAETGGAVLAAALCCLLIMRVPCAEKALRRLPKFLRLALPVGLGFMLVTEGLVRGRLLMGEPTTLLMLGDLSDPVAFFSLLGIVIMAGLWAIKMRRAVLIGMVAIAGLSYLEGFWIFPPEAVWQIPDFLTQPTGFPFAIAGDVGEWWQLVFLLLLIMVTESLAVADALRASPQGKRLMLTGVLVINIFAAGCGSLPLRLAPETAVCATNRRFSVGKFALFLLPLIFAGEFLVEPLSFAAITAPALTMIGLWLMVDDLARMKFGEFDFAEQFAALSIIIVMGLTRDILSAVWIALISWSVLKFISKNVTIHG